MKEKIALLKRLGFNVTTLDKQRIRAQKDGYIATGTINQVYEDIRHGGHRLW